MLADRMIIATIDDVVRMLSDYCGSGDIPADSKPLRLQHHSTDKGKLSIIIDSPTLTTSSPLEVKFDIRRNYLVGG